MIANKQFFKDGLTGRPGFCILRIIIKKICIWVVISTQLVQFWSLIGYHNLTWYLFVELNGISQILLFLCLNWITFPMESSTHFRRADSEASPLHSLKG